MPRLPQVTNDVSPQTPNRSLGVAAQPGEALASFGQDVAAVGSDIVQKQIHLQQLNDYTTGSTQAALAIDEAVRAERENPDFRTQPERINKAVQIITQNTLKNTLYPQVREKLQQDLEQQRVQAITNARTDSFNKERDYGRAMFLTSLDQSRNRLNTLNGMERDFELANVVGRSDATLHAGLFGQQEMGSIMKNFSSGIAEDQARIDGINDPAGTAAKLIGGHEFDAIDPTNRLQLAQQIMMEDEKRQNERIKQIKEMQEGDVTVATASALKGQLTFQQLEDLKDKYARIGVPLSRENYEHVFDLINRPLQQQPSDPQTISDMKILVHSMNPPPLSTLLDLHQQGKLNLDDRAALAVSLEQNRKSQFIQNRAQMEKVIADEFGGDKEIHAAALKDLISGATLKQIEDTYQPVYKLSSDFKGAQAAYETALNKQANWKSNHFFSFIKTDPNQDEVTQRTEQFISAAKKAKKLMGPAPPGTPEGKIFRDPQGNSYIAVSGQYIAQ